MTKGLPSADIFNKISDADEKSKLFESLTGAKTDLHAKLPAPSELILAIIPHKYSSKLLYGRIKNSPANFPAKGNVVLSFFIGSEKYFSQADYSVKDDIICFQTDEPLFHMQRREDYRIRIPTGTKAFLEIFSISGQIQKHTLNLIDLSGGGCRAKFDPKNLNAKANDQVRGQLTFPNRTPIAITAILRHMRAEPPGKIVNTAGFQFVELSQLEKNRIIALVMDLYREYFRGRG